MDAKQGRNWVELDLGGRVPVRSWVPAEEIYADGELLKQARDVSMLEPIVGTMVLAADCHPGYGMPIGGIAALEGAISPFCVGMDAGCGCLALRLDAGEDELRDAVARGLLPAIAERVPVGKGGHREHAVPLTGAGASVLVSQKVRDVVPYQLGTLGAGNHFQSVDHDDEGRGWVVIHSGSRLLGKEIAEHYHRLAVRQCRDLGVRLPNGDLAYLIEGTPEFDAYVEALAFALDWALENRHLMADDMVAVIGHFLGRDVATDDLVNVHHNYASVEDVGGTKAWVHRKGATRAEAGERLLIPGHVAAGSWLCEGLGSEDSIRSSSHGAGRRMGRNQAKRSLDIDRELAKLVAARVTLWTPGGARSALDEMPAAYKDVGCVMSRQDDLIAMQHHLNSIGVIKG